MTQKFTVQDALDIINKEVLPKGSIFSLDKPERTKSHSFAVGSITGKQFAIILGKKSSDGKFLNNVRIIAEKTSNPEILGARWSDIPYKGGKVSKQQTTSLGHPNNLAKSTQTSFFIDNEAAFRSFIYWYAKGTNPQSILGRDNRHGLSINNEDIQKHDSKLTEHLVNVASESTDPTTITQLIEARRGQEKFRQNAIEVWGLGECCAVTGISIKPLLIASHIIPWRESDDTQRLSGTNGILLCSHLDKLFDQHLISFDSDGNLITSTALNEPDWNQLKTIGVDKSLRLNTEKLSPENAAEIAKNLKEHRDKLINF